MADLTDDPRDPRLTRGVDATPVPQAEAYLVLSEAERAQGFVRPLRKTYVHVGPGGSELARDAIGALDPTRHGRTLSILGDLACGRVTRMSLEIAETYARDPKFYGATYCVGCQAHLPVDEFIWGDALTDERVGS